MHSAEQESRHHDSYCNDDDISCTHSGAADYTDECRGILLTQRIAKTESTTPKTRRAPRTLSKSQRTHPQIKRSDTKRTSGFIYAWYATRPHVQPLNTVNNSMNDISVGDTSSEPKNPDINPHWLLEVELLKKLHLQRIQQQIEIEEAIHKLEMEQLLTLK